MIIEFSQIAKVDIGIAQAQMILPSILIIIYVTGFAKLAMCTHQHYLKLLLTTHVTVHCRWSPVSSLFHLSTLCFYVPIQVGGSPTVLLSILATSSRLPYHELGSSSCMNTWVNRHLWKDLLPFRTSLSWSDSSEN